MSAFALIVAAGRGLRARRGGFAENETLAPKQYAVIGGRPVLAWAIQAFVEHPEIEGVGVVIHGDDRKLYERAVASCELGGCGAKLFKPVIGGRDRQASVRLGLESLRDVAPDWVLVHDAARPFVDGGTIDRVVHALSDFDGVVCAAPVADTLKRVGPNGQIVETVSREGLWRAQTPQGFRFGALAEAHEKAAGEVGLVFTDDASVAEWAGLRVGVVMGCAGNDKLTTFEEISMADARLAALGDSRRASCDIRLGNGYDVHKFGAGSNLWLCGVEIAHGQTLIGHSDADVGLHALTDAILGAIGDGDIGAHFPPSDPKWKGARSDIFLAHAASLVRKGEGEIINVDLTIICEEPKVGPHRDEMRETISRILAIDVSRVSVKATTSEGLGFTGRGEGIAAMASATVRVPG